jgi:hypothetical protein
MSKSTAPPTEREVELLKRKPGERPKNNRRRSSPIIPWPGSDALREARGCLGHAKLPQAGQKRQGRLVAGARITRNRAPNYRLNFRRKPVNPSRRHLLCKSGSRTRSPRGFPERSIAGDGFQQHHSERKQVRASIHCFPADLFGSHVTWSSCHSGAKTRFRACLDCQPRDETASNLQLPIALFHLNFECLQDVLDLRISCPYDCLRLQLRPPTFDPQRHTRNSPLIPATCKQS